MKKGILIVLCSLAVLFAACTKPEPDPDPVDYTPNYVGNYLGQFMLTVNSMNNQPQTSWNFPIDGISMKIAKAEQFNAITATVTVDNESRQTSGTATADKADFETVNLVIDKPDQNYSFNLNLKMEGTKAKNDTLNIIGTFTGQGNFTMPTGEVMILNEVSGNVSGILVEQ